MDFLQLSQLVLSHSISLFRRLELNLQTASNLTSHLQVSGFLRLLDECLFDGYFLFEDFIFNVSQFSFQVLFVKTSVLRGLKQFLELRLKKLRFSFADLYENRSMVINQGVTSDYCIVGSCSPVSTFQRR